MASSGLTKGLINPNCCTGLRAVLCELVSWWMSDYTALGVLTRVNMLYLVTPGLLLTSTPKCWQMITILLLLLLCYFSLLLRNSVPKWCKYNCDSWCVYHCGILWWFRMWSIPCSVFLFYHWLLSNYSQHCKGLTNHPVVKGAQYTSQDITEFTIFFMNLRVSVNTIMHWYCIFPSKFCVSVSSWSLQFVFQRNLASRTATQYVDSLLTNCIHIVIQWGK